MRTQLKTVFLIATLAFPLLAEAQAGTLTISGVVTDKVSRRPVEGAKVTVVGNKAKSDTTTDSEGSFIVNLAQGTQANSTLRLRVEKSGYKPYEKLIALAPAITLQVSLLPLRIPPPKTPAPVAAPQSPGSTPPKVEVNAPNGVVINGPNFGNPTVNNTFSDRYPRPGVVPRVTFCVTQPATGPGQDYKTIIAVKTDTPISNPFWGFFFDGPVVDGTSTVEQQGVVQAHVLNHGHPSGEMPNKERILRLQVSLGTPFTGVQQPWGPDDEIKFTITSEASVHLVQVVSGYGAELLNEQMVFECAKPPVEAGRP